MNGRPTKVQHASRLDTIWPEEWPRLSQKQKTEEIANQDEEKTRGYMPHGVVSHACIKSVVCTWNGQTRNVVRFPALVGGEDQSRNR